MAIGGTSLECYNIRPIGGELRIISTTRMAAHLVIKDPAKALREIEQRGQAALWVGENNWMKIKELWAAKQSVMTEDGKGGAE